MDSELHELALRWFDREAGRELTWSELSDVGVRLATAAKGIYKPEGSKYALSVSQRLGSSYADEELISSGSEAWKYRYHQEGETTSDKPVPNYTNQGLMNCLQDQVPVGVLIQVMTSPAVYRVIGLALVEEWSDGFFLLRGVRLEELDSPVDQAYPIWQLPLEDTRERARALVVRRYGQPKFRAALLKAYGSACAITGTNVIGVLEAAHITPYQGPTSDHLPNGLLLRSDIHALFDLGLIAVDSKSMKCLTATELNSSTYSGLSGQELFLPKDPKDMPSSLALDHHREWAGI